MIPVYSKSIVLTGSAISTFACRQFWKHLCISQPSLPGQLSAGLQQQPRRPFMSWLRRCTGQDWNIQSRVGTDLGSSTTRSDDQNGGGRIWEDGTVADHDDDITHGFRNRHSDARDDIISTEDNTNDDTPWYLEVEPPSRPIPHLTVPLPQLPHDSPPILLPILSYVYDTMGLDDLQIIDLRALDPPNALGPNLVMVFATARSDRHLNVSCRLLLSWLRREHAVHAEAAGLVSPREIKLKLKRMQRRARIVGPTGGHSASGWGGGSSREHALSTGWVCVNLGTLGESGMDRSKIKTDMSGKLSGFGLMRTGMTVVLQAMTEDKRKELDLETMWKDMLTENDKVRADIEADEHPKTSTEALVKEETQYNAQNLITARSYTHVTPQAVFTNSLNDTQRREFSTRAYSLSDYSAYYTTQAIDHLPNAKATFPFSQLKSPSPPEADAPFDALVQYVVDIKNSVASPSPTTYAGVIQLIIFNSTAPPDQKLSLVERLLATMSERHLNLLTHDILVPMITALARVNLPAEPFIGRPAPHPILLRAQTNLETLQYTAGLPCPPELHIIALLSAYAVQDSWPRFWDTFRLPTRYKRNRSPRLFLQIFNLLAATGSQHKCAEGLREAVPDMLRERNPHVPLTPQLYAAILDCINIAEPLASVTFEQERSRDGSSMVTDRSVSGNHMPEETDKRSRWEFVKMLRTLNQVWLYSETMS